MPNGIETIVNYVDHANGNPYTEQALRQRLADLGRVVDAHERFYGLVVGRHPDRRTADFIFDVWGQFARGWQDAQGSLSLHVHPTPGDPRTWTTTVDPGYTVPPLDWMDQVARETTAGLAQVRAEASRAGVPVPPVGGHHTR